MNLGHQRFATLDGYGDDAPTEMAGIGKKLKKLRNAVSKTVRKVHGVDVAKKALGKKTYGKIKKRGQKLEKFAKRNGVKIAGAVATVATGGAAAPALLAAAKSMAVSEAARKLAQKHAEKKQKKMMKAAERQIDREAAAYEASLDRQDAATAAQQAAAGSASGPVTQPPAEPAAKPSGAGWMLPAALIGTVAAVALG